MNREVAGIRIMGDRPFLERVAADVRDAPATEWIHMALGVCGLALTWHIYKHVRSR